MTALRPLLVCAAVRPELEGLIQCLDHPAAHITGGREIITGTLEKKRVAVLITGPGMINTAQALTAVFEHDLPDIVLQTGCAGAFRQSGLGIGDIAVATQAINAELGVEALEDDMRLTHALPFAVLEGHSVDIRHAYPVNSLLAQSAFAILKRTYADTPVQVKPGPIISVATITASERRATRLYAQFAPVMEAMEGAAAAHVAFHYHIPFIEIRAASNDVAERDRRNWNLELAFERNAAAAAAFIREYEPDIDRLAT